MQIKLSQYVADFLVGNGIDTTFMITGGGAMHLDDALGHKEGMHCIYNHNEQGCSVAAEGYTRLTGRLAAVCVTSGPGGTKKDKQMAGRHSWKRLHNSFKMVYQYGTAWIGNIGKDCRMPGC